MRRIVVIGLGGIGSHLVEPLARYVSGIVDRVELHLVDGDTYSPGNADRQRTGVGQQGVNKAEAQATFLRPQFPTLSISARAEFVSERNVAEIIVEGNAVFVGVDNHATRKVVSDRARRLREVLLISAGNDRTDGNVQVYWRQNGRRRTVALDRYHPEIRFPTDRNPADLSCEQLAALPGGAQIIFTNLTAAALALNAYYAATAARLTYGEVYFDILTNRSRPVERK
ncbi:MAG: ThiF family adenylyltransferase [Planctomycetes bacterium]|nr:ThiF family adenylyltransferase [Planctomycetota bacterium]